VFRTGLKGGSFVRINEFKAFPGARGDGPRPDESILIGALSELITSPVVRARRKSEEWPPLYLKSL